MQNGSGSGCVVGGRGEEKGETNGACALDELGPITDQPVTRRRTCNCSCKDLQDLQDEQTRRESPAEERWRSLQAAMEEKWRRKEQVLDERCRSKEATLEERWRILEAALEEKVRSKEAGLEERYRSMEAALQEKWRSKESALDERWRSLDATLEEKWRVKESLLDERWRNAAEVDEDKRKRKEAIWEERWRSLECCLEERCNARDSLSSEERWRNSEGTWKSREIALVEDRCKSMEVAATESERCGMRSEDPKNVSSLQPCFQTVSLHSPTSSQVPTLVTLCASSDAAVTTATTTTTTTTSTAPAAPSAPPLDAEDWPSSGRFRDQPISYRPHALRKMLWQMDLKKKTNHCK